MELDIKLKTLIHTAIHKKSKKWMAHDAYRKAQNWIARN